MTKETPAPKNSDKEYSSKVARPTVFSDGSTFDYVNGYQSNGAPTRSRNSTPARIVKSGAIMSVNSLANLLIALLLATLLGFVAWHGAKAYHEQANEKTIISNINLSGQAEVLGDKILKQDGKNTIIVRDLADKNTYKCDVLVVTEDTATALVFCNPGPANFTIPVPYDPENIFYTTPKQDS